MKKIVEINSYMLGTIAGGAADCQYWERELMRQCRFSYFYFYSLRLYELSNKRPISVAAASKILNNIMYYYKDQGMSMVSFNIYFLI